MRLVVISACAAASWNALLWGLLRLDGRWGHVPRWIVGPAFVLAAASLAAMALVLLWQLWHRVGKVRQA